METTPKKGAEGREQEKGKTAEGGPQEGSPREKTRNIYHPKHGPGGEGKKSWKPGRENIKTQTQSVQEEKRFNPENVWGVGGTN